MKYDPWSDKECIVAFIEKYEESFDEWLENNRHHGENDTKDKYYLTYCEKNESDFIDFAYEFEKDVNDYYAEQINELRNEK